LYFRDTPPEKDVFLSGLRQAYPTTLERFIEACVPEPDSDHIKRWGRQILDRASQAAAIALYQAAGEVDLRDELRHITQPALILHGEADVIVPVEAARQLAESLPHAKLKVFSETGHVPTLTRPREVAQEIMDFLGLRFDH
jgi:pimeloyl-[acyl-carrier protein] methyl ester esterase